MECTECKQYIQDENEIVAKLKGNPFVQYAPVDEEVEREFYHKRCAPTSDNMTKILQMNLHNPIISRILSEKDFHELTWRETLEVMVVALAQNQQHLENVMLQRLYSESLPNRVLVPKMSDNSLG